MTQDYEEWAAEEKFLLSCAPHLGFFSTSSTLLFIMSETSQIDLQTINMIPLEDCGSVEVAIR